MRCIILSVALIVYTEAVSHHWKSSEEFGSSEEYSSSLRPIIPDRITHNEQQGPGQPPFFMTQPHHCDSKVKSYSNEESLKYFKPSQTKVSRDGKQDIASEERSTSSESSILNQPKDVAKDYGLSDAFIKPIHLPTIVIITDVPKVHVLNGTVRSSEELLTSSESISSKNSGNETLDNRRPRPVPVRRRPELIPLDHKGPVTYVGYSSEEDSEYSKPFTSKKAQVGIKDESVRLPTDTHNSNLPLNKKYQPSRYLYSEEEYEQNSQRYVPKHKSKKHKHRNSDYGQSENHIKPIHLPTIVKITDVPKKHDLNGHSIDERLTSSDSIPSKRPSTDSKVSDDGLTSDTLIPNSHHSKKHKTSKYLYSDNYDETYPRYRPTKQRSGQQFNIDYSQPSLNKRLDY